MTIEVHTAHTSELDIATLKAIRVLLHEAYEGDMSDHDWDHTLGGMHALVWEAGVLVGHGAVVQRRLLHGGRALRTGYVEGVAVRADRRGLGYGAAVMDVLESVLRAAYDVGALSASEDGLTFYAARGWQVWRGPSSVLTPTGVERTDDEDGGIFVLPVGVPLDLTGGLTCDWRDGDVW